MRRKVMSVACTMIFLVIIIVCAIFGNNKDTKKENPADMSAMAYVAVDEDDSQEGISTPEVILEAGIATLLDSEYEENTAVPGEMTRENMHEDDSTGIDTTASELDETDSQIQTGVQSESEETVDVEDESEYKDLAIADVNNYVNVRTKPDTTSQIVGKMYDGSVAQILDTVGEGEDKWFKVVSGNVEGYIKAQYFIFGKDAQKVIEEYIIRYAVIKADRLNVRNAPDITAGRIGYLAFGEKVKVAELEVESAKGKWIKVFYTSDKTGYVSADYVTIEESFIYAKSIEEEKAELEALKALQERQSHDEKKAPENPVIQVTPPPTDYANVSELRNAIVNYAMQYLGNRYIMGGQTLAGGTDCSGFTCYIYREFGINLSRLPQGQWTSNGRQIDVSLIQPGDIVCYSQNGSTCSHVGIYIGNGQIIHSANSRKGVIISNIYYDNTFIGVKNVLD